VSLDRSKSQLLYITHHKHFYDLLVSSYNCFCSKLYDPARLGHADLHNLFIIYVNYITGKTFLVLHGVK